MSGITGIFRRDGKDVDPADIKKMNDKISHRGLDGSRIWCEGPVAFGHQMLHTTIESLQETLPFEDKESGLVITADARIDNRKELAPKLGIEDKQHVSDSYFILKAYEKWGEKCPEELLGDFAFAIWDKNKENMFCARDHMGVKPFYYYLSDDLFVFGTEIKTILAIPNIPYKLDEMKLAFFLHIFDEIEDKELTFFKDILRLIPAHTLSINQHHNKFRKYWTLDPDSNIIMESEEDYITEFRKIFSEAIKCRMRSSFPIGFDLSGGLDSSSIVCMAKKNNINDSHYDDLKTFSYVFNDFPDSDERFYIERVVDTGGIQAYTFFADEISPLDGVDNTLDYLDQPHFNPFLPLIQKSIEEMSKQGIRNILSGAGGDMVIYAGKNYFLELVIKFQWFRLIKEIKKWSGVMGYSAPKMFLGITLQLIPAILKKNFKKMLCHLDWSVACPTSYLNIAFAKKQKIKHFKNLKNINKVKEHHYHLINLSNSQRYLEVVDITSASFYIEPRYPYYDKRLIEFCYSIPTEMKFNVWNRYIQRIAMDNILPFEIQWRVDKGNFKEFFTKNFLLFEEDRLDMMIANNEIIRDYIDFDRLKMIYRNYKYNKRVAYADIYFLWLSLMLFIWFRKTEIY
ncbi:asparagine synthase (glutamine-hydrolyzing) [Methanobacterium ferruginis]|uniref:asparagine synthase (glutamine-hydrolyzing) n=1 Tax=Methanobacterium ferruginis TaxID=710191 RepID=UPI002573EB55|nr:asparagine synthase (glutamine-hydrolyzing) [Methanobacterium ferruginis]BDZ69015.1 asparagine synthetase B [Methanobacterium ferruginis]